MHILGTRKVGPESTQPRLAAGQVSIVESARPHAQRPRPWSRRVHHPHERLHHPSGPDRVNTGPPWLRGFARSREGAKKQRLGPGASGLFNREDCCGVSIPRTPDVGCCHRLPRWGGVALCEGSQGSATLHPGLSPCAALRLGSRGTVGALLACGIHRLVGTRPTPAG